MQFCLLGPLRVADDARTYTPTAPKLRKVLSLLLLNANQLVPIGTLMEELWGEHSPSSASTTLQTYIYQLRKLIGPANDRQSDDCFLLTRPTGYLARARPGELDVPLFQQQVEQSRRAADNDDPEQVARLLREALMLWRGPALVDVVHGPLLEAHTTLLEESRICALERRIDADLQLGRHGELIGELRALVATHPLREGFHAQLILALSRAGRRPEALQVYQALRRVLVEELGIEPSHGVQRLQRAVLSADGSVDLATREKVRVHNPGLLAPPAQLPPDINDFIDRDEEIRRLEQLVGGSNGAGQRAVPMAIFTGRPGIGKTVLAVRAAHRLRPRFPDGQLFADLRGGAADPAEVLASFLRALGFSNGQVPQDLEERTHLFRTWSADRRLLVVLDNAYSTPQVRPLLPSGERCAVIVTSWRRLCGLAGAETIELDVLREDGAVRLLVALVGRERVDADPDAALSLIRLCDHLPLAIRIAGTRLASRRGWPIGWLTSRLYNACSRLNELHIGDLDVRASLEASYQRLGESEQQAFRLLSLLDRGHATAWTGEVLLGADPHGAERIMSRLVESYMLDVAGIDAQGSPSYQVSGLLRSYARELLEREESPPTVQAALERIRLIDYLV